MTKKHFCELAKLARSLRGDMDEKTFGLMVDQLSDYCSGFNALFDEKKFKDACYAVVKN